MKPFDWYLKPRGWPERTEAFLEGAEALFVDVARKALATAHLGGADIDTVVTVCSTGIATPSLEARVARAMGFRSDVCACRCSALAARAAFRVCRLPRASRRRGPAPTCCWSRSSCVRWHFAMTNSQRPTSSPSACSATALLRSSCAPAMAVRLRSRMPARHLWPDTLGIMGWSVDPEGFGVIFRRTIPDFVASHLNPAVMQILAQMQLSMADIDRFVCHPGGARVIRRAGDCIFTQSGDARPRTADIADYGNMSSPTVLFVLERTARQGTAGAIAVNGARTRLHASCVALRHAT